VSTETEWERSRPPLKRITSPAAPDNLLALKHGAYSEQKIAERAATVHEHLLEVAPWCDQAHYMPSVMRYTQATAREQLAHEALMDGAKLSPRLLEAVTSAARLAWMMADQLGLTPAGHAKLKILAAGGEQAEATVADLMAAGRASRLAAEARMAAELSGSPPGAALPAAVDTDRPETSEDLTGGSR
jgi:hypothetical protein